MTVCKWVVVLTISGLMGVLMGSSATTAPAVAKEIKSTKDAKQTKEAGENRGTTQPAMDPNEQASYALGVQMGRSYKRMKLDVNPRRFAQGMQDGMGEDEPQMTQEQIRKALERMMTESRAKLVASQSSAGVNNRKEGMKFLANNKAKEGVKVLPSGLQYKVLKPGTGEPAKDNDTVECYYKGAFVDGTIFDSTKNSRGPAAVRVREVIAGWNEALKLMPLGAKWELYIPSDLAYGEQGHGQNIGPNTTLVYEVEVVGIIPAETTQPEQAGTPQSK